MTLEQQLEASSEKGAFKGTMRALLEYQRAYRDLTFIPGDDDVLTVEEAATAARVSLPEMRSLLNNGRVSATRLNPDNPNSHWRIRRAALRRFLDPRLVQLDLNVLDHAAD